MSTAVASLRRIIPNPNPNPNPDPNPNAAKLDPSSLSPPVVLVSHHREGARLYEPIDDFEQYYDNDYNTEYTAYRPDADPDADTNADANANAKIDANDNIGADANDANASAAAVGDLDDLFESSDEN